MIQYAKTAANETGGMLCEKVCACDALNAFLLCAFQVRRPVGAAGVIVLLRPKNVSCGNASSQSRFLAFSSHGEGEENVVYLFGVRKQKRSGELPIGECPEYRRGQ